MRRIISLLYLQRATLLLYPCCNPSLVQAAIVETDEELRRRAWLSSRPSCNDGGRNNAVRGIPYMTSAKFLHLNAISPSISKFFLLFVHQVWTSIDQLPLLYERGRHILMSPRECNALRSSQGSSFFLDRRCRLCSATRSRSKEVLLLSATRPR